MLFEEGGVSVAQDGEILINAWPLLVTFSLPLLVTGFAVQRFVKMGHVRKYLQIKERSEGRFFNNNNKMHWYSKIGIFITVQYQFKVQPTPYLFPLLLCIFDVKGM
jgi:hypothetical protein